MAPPKRAYRETHAPRYWQLLAVRRAELPRRGRPRIPGFENRLSIVCRAAAAELSRSPSGASLNLPIAQTRLRASELTDRENRSIGDQACAIIAG